MANEIVEFKADNGALVTITPDDVKNQLCPAASDKEIFLFLELCKAQRLNPWIGDAYLVKYGDAPAQMLAGKETFTKRAAANPEFKGFEAGITFTDAQGHIRQREGSAIYVAIGETLIGGWAKVYVEDKQPFYDEVALTEYSTGRNLWKSKPATMIRKVALVHALREAFPDSFAGLYSAEEMPDGPQQTPVSANVESVKKESKAASKRTPAKKAKSKGANKATVEELARLIDELAGLRGADVSAVQKALFDSKAVAQYREAGDGGELTESVAKAAIGQANAWIYQARQKAREAEADAQAQAPDGQDELPDMPEYEIE